MDRLDEYLAVWAGEARKSVDITPTGGPRLDLDLNPRVPKTWHFGPQPTGWDLSGLNGFDSSRRPATWCTSESGHAPGTPKAGMWEVSTRWVQERMKALGKRITVDGAYGPQTASVLQSWISSLGVTSGYQFDRGCGVVYMQVSTLLERALAAIDVELLERERTARSGPDVSTETPAEEPPPPSVVSSVGAVLPLAALGVGLFLLFRR